MKNTAVISLFLLDGTWYFTRDVHAEDGDIRNLQNEEVSVPELGWEFYDASYFDNNFDNCKTIR